MGFRPKITPGIDFQLSQHGGNHHVSMQGGSLLAIIRRLKSNLYFSAVGLSYVAAGEEKKQGMGVSRDPRETQQMEKVSNFSIMCMTFHPNDPA